jgi:hypothetical protein
MNKIYTLFLFFISLSCTKTDKYLINNKSGIQVELKNTEINVNIDSGTLNAYNILTSLYFNGKDYIFANNYQTHAIDRINITDNSISHIELDLEGPNGINNITGIYANSLDSIWIATRERISLIDSAGKVTRRISLLERVSGTVLIMSNFSTCTSKFYYNAKRNSLFYLVMSVNDNKSTFFVEELFLSDNSKKEYSIQCHVEKDLRNDYGWKQSPNVTFTDSKILYDFPIESNIYVIDIETGKNNVYGGKSQFTKNEVDKLTSPFDFQQGDRHICENVHFFEINYDCINDVYYRLHLGEIPSDATQDFESIYNKKEIYLMVFNNKFEVINETKLNNQKYNYRNCWGITSKGFFISRSNMFYKDIEFEEFQMDIFSP